MRKQDRLAVLVNSIVGGTPAYRREFVAGDSPASLADFDSWVPRTVLNPRLPLFREARYLLAEEAGIRGTAPYHAVLGAIAAGNATRGGVGHLERLRRAASLLPVKGYDTSETRLACYSGAGFDSGLRDAARRGPILGYGW